MEISYEWSSIQIDGGTNPIKTTRLANLRHKIIKHKNSNAHIFAANIEKDKNCNILSNAFQTSNSNLYNSTTCIFRTAYFIAKYNRPFDDHSKLIELQKLNKINLGTTLHSRYSSTMIISHIAEEMKNKIIQNIIRTSSKISVLIDESTTTSSLSGMVVFIKASISHSESIFIFLDLVELKSQTAANIVDS